MPSPRDLTTARWASLIAPAVALVMAFAYDWRTGVAAAAMIVLTVIACAMWS